MDAALYQRLERIFLEVRDLPEDRRAAMLEEIGRCEPELRSELERLLHHDGRSSAAGAVLAEGVGARVLAGLIDEDRPAGVDEAAPGPESDDLPRQIGRYRIVRLIGHGGMGVVYEAEQDDPRRRVALKIIRGGIGSATALERFHREAQMLGRLRHRGIAQIYDAHTSPAPGEPPHFVMELVHGPTLLKFAEIARLDIRQRLELIAEVCDALDHAHQNGLIHRDLKPGNILIEPRLTGSSGASNMLDSIETRVGGQPKILDFGVARNIDANTVTDAAPGRLIGTVQYFSPEQAAGAALDARSDVYSVGVIMFELLSGRLPYDLSGKMIHEAARIIRDEEPPLLGSIERRLRGDAEVIVAKALEKDVAWRYSSAAALAADIRRLLCDQPIVARPPSLIYQLRKRAIRNRQLAAGLVIAGATVLIAGAVSLDQFRAARSAESESDRQRAVADDAAWRRYVGAISGAGEAIKNHNPDAAEAFLASAGSGPDQHRWEYGHVAARLGVYGPVLQTDAPIVAAIFDPADDRILTVCRDGRVQWWDVGAAGPHRTVELGQRVTGPAAFSATGRFLAAAVGPEAFALTVFDCATGNELARLSADEISATMHHEDPKPIRAVGISADGDRVALGARGGLLWHRSADRRWRWLYNLHIDSLTFNADGRRLLCGYLDPRVENFGLIRALDTLRTSGAHTDQRIPVTSILPMVVAGPVPHLTIGEGESATELTFYEMGYQNRSFGDSTLRMTAVAFDPRTPRLAIATVDTLIRVYDGGSRKLIRSLAGPGGTIGVLAFNRDDSLMLAAADQTIRIYRLNRLDAVRVIGGLRAPAAAVGWTDASTVIGVGDDGRARGWDATTGARVAMAADPALAEGPQCAAVSTDGSLIATGHGGGIIRLAAAAKAPSLAPLELGEDAPVIAMAVDGDRLVAGTDARIGLWSLGDAAPRWRAELVGGGRAGGLALAVNSSLVAAAAGGGGRVRVWDAATGRERPEIRPEASAAEITTVTLSPVGGLVVVGAEDGSLSVWNDRGEAVAIGLRGHNAAVRAVAFAPDGTRAASASDDRTIVLWDVLRWEPVLTLEGHEAGVRALAFSPDGLRLASGGADGAVRVWVWVSEGGR